MKKLEVIVVAMLFIAILLSSNVMARVRYVPGSYPTIQAGINSASWGDVVLVAPGEYTESITLKPGVTVKSNDAEATIIRGDGSWFRYPSWSYTVFTANNSTVSNLTIIGSNKGIVCSNASPTIANNIIRNNWSAGIYCSNSSALIKNNLITNNGDYSIWCMGSSLKIVNNIFTENKSAIICGGSSPVIANNVFIKNQVHGIYCYSGSSPIITNNTIADNRVDGIQCYVYSSPTITNNIISNNGFRGINCYHYCFPEVSFNNVWNNTRGNYYGISDPTGIDGNISTDPIFVDSGWGDYHLLFSSPCVDAGTNYAPHIQGTDFDGKPRISDDNGDGTAIIEMGAYEGAYPPPPNRPPTANAGGPYEGYPYVSIAFNAGASFDHEGEPLLYRWDFNGDGTWDTDWLDNPISDYAYSIIYSGMVVLEITDGELTDLDTAYVNILTVQEVATVINEEIQTLPDEAFDGNPAQRKNAMSNKIDALIEMINEAEALIDAGLYGEASDKLQHDIRPKMDGSLGGNPRNDWITDPDAQAELCIMVDGLIAYLEDMIAGLARRLAEESILKPTGMFLNAYPNPFNASIRIEAPEEAVISIYNIKGQEINKFTGGSILWTPDNNLAGGIYLVRTNWSGKTEMKKLVFMK